MYRHILIATDGSKLAAKGVRMGVGLAKALRAKITGIIVVEPFVPPMYIERESFSIQGRSRKGYLKFVEKEAKKALDAIARAARAAGVNCVTRSLTDERPWHGILRVARARRCDAIVMASHGRSAVGGLILGSETSRVLAHSRIPVVVVR